MRAFKSLLLVPALFLPGAGASQPAEPVSLGFPVRSMTIWDSLVVREDEKPILYAGTFTGEGNARVIRYDQDSGSVDYFPLHGARGAYGLLWDDGVVYAGSIMGAAFHKVDPSSGRVTNLGSPAPDEQYIWRLERGPEGQVYGSTYPGAKVIEYDPATGELRDHGPMHPDRQYAIHLASGPDGRLFVGIGTPAALIAYDPETGEREEVSLHGYEKNAFAYPAHEEGALVVRFAGDHSVLIYDAVTLELLEELDAERDGVEYGFSRPSHGAPLLVTGFPDGPKVYDRAKGVFAPSPIASATLFDPVSGMGFSVSPTELTATDHRSGEVVGTADISADGEGMEIMSIAVGPDGRIYGGVSNLLHLWQYDPEAGRLSNLGGFIPGHGGQFYDFCNVGGRMYMGSYTHALISVHDTRAPWDPSSGENPNPRLIGPVGEDQYRPLALLAGSDSRVYIGSTPTYGQTGGALSVLDTGTEQITVHRSVLGNHSVSALAEARDGTIYAGTTLSSSGGEVTFDPAEAHVFAWHRESSQVEYSFVPVPGAGAVSSLVLGPEGLLFGSAGDCLFVHHPGERERSTSGPSTVGRISHLCMGPDGEIYGLSRSALVRLQRNGEDAPSVQRLADGGLGLAISPAGDIYFGRGPRLMRLEGLARPHGEHPGGTSQ